MRSRREADKRWLATQEAAARVIFADRKLLGIPSIRDPLVSEIAHRAYTGRSFMTPACIPLRTDPRNREVIIAAARQAHDMALSASLGHRGPQPAMLPEPGARQMEFALTFA